jgi:hypothetical protein
MVAVYSEQFLLKLARTTSSQLGIRLGKVCVDANLPPLQVAKALNVSRWSVYRWFRGADIKEKDHENIMAFISMVEGGLADGVLPALTLSDAKHYLKLDA